VLDVLGGVPFNGATTILYGSRNAASQLWNFLPTGDGGYRFTPGSNILSSLTRGALVEQWTYTGVPNQQWTVAPAN
jgi:alpha-L-fucosidase